MSGPLFSILHTTARPKEWRAAYDKWIERAADPDSVEYVLCVDERWGFVLHDDSGGLDEWESARAKVVPRIRDKDGRNLLVWNIGRKCCVDGWNWAARGSSGSILILASDDIEPPEKWDGELLSALIQHTRDSGAALMADSALHVSTGYFDGPQASSLPILSRARYQRLGYVLYPGYESLYSDDDFWQHAYQDGVVIDARHLMFPHKHSPMAEWDEVYWHQNREEAKRAGRELLEKRKARGFKE